EALAGPPTVRMLAAEIDKLERHIEKYGSVVPKQADVWGQARLMMYRAEFEKVMRPDAYLPFQPGIQAVIATSDQALLESALSVEAAAAGAKSVSGTDLASLVSKPDEVIRRSEKTLQGATISRFVGSDGRLILEPSIIEDQKRRFL